MVTGRDGSIAVDFIERTLWDVTGGDTDRVPLVPDESCRLQHEAILSDSPGPACTCVEGYETVRLIEVIEQTAAQRRWVEAG